MCQLRVPESETAGFSAWVLVKAPVLPARSQELSTLFFHIFWGIMVSTVGRIVTLHAEEVCIPLKKHRQKPSNANAFDMAPSLEEADAVLARFGFVDAEELALA